MDTLGGVLADLGMGEVEALDPSRRGAADISFVAADVEASMAGLFGWFLAHLPVNHCQGLLWPSDDLRRFLYGLMKQC